MKQATSALDMQGLAADSSGTVSEGLFEVELDFLRILSLRVCAPLLFRSSGAGSWPADPAFGR